jgi:predicted metalloprotease
MRWRRARRSDPAIDRRDSPESGRGLPGPVALGGGIGVPALLLLAVLLLLDLGGSGFDIDTPLDRLPGSDAPAQAPISGPDPDLRLARFLRFVFDDAQAFWADTFAASRRPYRLARLELFNGAIPSACGVAREELGPHYCPIDESVYVDLGFFAELRDRFQAPGDFAQAYVVAHELGHHVQHLLGISDDVHRAQSADPGAANELSIRLELQADCLAGVWAFTTYERELLEAGDLEEGLAAAAAVGDDRIQAQATGRVDPETWTHGSSEQRVRWFLTGYENGDPNDCDTFAPEEV